MTTFKSTITILSQLGLTFANTALIYFHNQTNEYFKVDYTGNPSLMDTADQHLLSQCNVIHKDTNLSWIILEDYCGNDEIGPLRTLSTYKDMNLTKELFACVDGVLNDCSLSKEELQELATIFGLMIGGCCFLLCCAGLIYVSVESCKDIAFKDRVLNFKDRIFNNFHCFFNQAKHGFRRSEHLEENEHKNLNTIELPTYGTT